MVASLGGGAVPEMLARAGAISTRPEGEIAALGIVEATAID